MSIPGSASPLLFAGVAADAAAFQIDRSLRFNSADSAYLSNTFSSAGNRRTWTLSFWLKRSKLSSSQQVFVGGPSDSDRTIVRLLSGNALEIEHFGSGSIQWQYVTTQLLRDVSAWYHICIAADTTLSTASDRIKLFVNGDRVTQFSTASNPSQNYESRINSATSHFIGKHAPSSGQYFDGYLADVHFIDGQALAASDFGEYDSNNVWQPKAFADAGPNNGTEWSSNSTNFTNPSKGFNGNSGDYAEVSSSGAKGTFTFPSSITVSSNVTFAFSSGTSGNLFVNDSSTAMQGTSFQVQTISFTGTLTKISLQSSSQPVLYYFAVDGVPLIDNLSHNYGVNGFNLKFADNSSNAALGTDSSGNSNTWTVNNLVATAGLATAAQGFDVVTYTGNGSTQSISGLAFQPDFVWVKRGNSASDHQLYDSVRGANKGLSTNLTSAEWTYSGGLSSFDSTGFSVGNLGGLNGSSDTHVAWCWKAGGTASSNTDGSITSSVSANSTYGFSIVSYTGNGSNATIGHGLSSAPKVIIKKFRSASSSWDVYHESVGAGKRLVLNSAATEASTSSYQNVNSSTFDVHAGNNDNGVPMIAYCWSEIAGFSKFGEYSGGCSSSVTVTTGFKPKFVIIKGKDVDSSPSGYRGWGMYQEPKTSQQLMAHCSGEEGVRGNCDTGSSKRDIQANVVFNNDGFTVDSCWFEQNDNTSGAKYVYMAFADKPPGEIVDSLIDTPTNYEADSGNNGGNYATLNPLVFSQPTLSNGNLEAAANSTWKSAFGTVEMPASGKTYWEATPSSATTIIGMAKIAPASNSYIGDWADSYGWYGNVGKKVEGPSNTQTTYASFSANDVIGLAYDADAGTLSFYKNGVSQGSAFTSLSGSFLPVISTYGGSVVVNFGQRPFAYTPPTGYKSLCTTNLPDPTIADGSTAFDAVTYSGNGTTQTITGINHSPDFVWIKCRNDSVGHQLFDQVRGAGKSLLSNTTEAERTNHIYGYLSAFTSDGFTVTAGSSDDFEVNGSTETYVAWNWDGGTSTASNTDGSITSNVRANASAGFSIGTYTGTYTAQPSSLDTVGHGLNAAPGLVITRSRGGSNWHVWHSALDNDEYLRLNSTNAKATLSTGAGGSIATAPTSSVFPTYFLGGSNNGPSDSLVFYCFAPVAGYSAFGSYTGNGSSDGPFVYTGFRPSLVVIKRTDAANDWNVQDHKRTAYNDQQTTSLQWNTSSSESDIGTDYRRDILSNGFKLRNTGTETNASGGTYVYLAFAEHPFKTSRAR
jgi:hypothetical protein